MTTDQPPRADGAENEQSDDEIEKMLGNQELKSKN
jgi:hypothetical protein